MADPMLVEFLRSRISYGIDEELERHKTDAIKKVLQFVREGHPATYQMGVADGFHLALSVLTKLRKQEG